MQLIPDIHCEVPVTILQVATVGMAADTPLGGWLSGGTNGYRAAVPHSCPHPLWPQEGIHSDSAPRDLAQAAGEPKGSLPAASEDVAQMRIGALSSFGKVFDGSAVGFGPAEHWMC